MKKIIVTLVAGLGLIITLPTSVNAGIIIVGDYTEISDDEGVTTVKCDPSEEVCVEINDESKAPPQAQNGLSNKPPRFTVYIPGANRTIKCFGYECMTDGNGKQEIRLHKTPE